METDQPRKATSKFLSFVLRHSPQSIGLTLDSNGWAEVGELIIKCAENNRLLTKEELQEIVETNDKQRFVFDDTKSRIRANQGHSIGVDLDLPESVPPPTLYHGTIAAFVESIMKDGLQKMSRQHVHLSKDYETAKQVGGRRGKPLILQIRTGAMHADGHKFYISANGVWLTDHVPPAYIIFEER